jgi:hypothetical protein
MDGIDVNNNETNTTAEDIACITFIRVYFWGLGDGWGIQPHEAKQTSESGLVLQYFHSPLQRMHEY